MKVMISQPMRGRSDAEVRNKRQEVIDILDKMHIEVIDTFFEDEVLGVNRPDIYLLSRAIEKMCEADAIIFVGDWQNARGCLVEHLVAERYGVKCLYEDFLEIENDEEECKNINITINHDHIGYSDKYTYM